MSHTIKRREFLAMAGVAGVAMAGMTHAESAETPAAAVSASTPEGAALVSVASAMVGYPLSIPVADEVRRKLSDYPTGFASARAVSIPMHIAPSMGPTPGIAIKRPKPQAKTKTKPKPAQNSTPALPSTGDVKPLPVPPGTYQN